MTTLYLDVTHTYVSGLATGIQRVVRKVTAELLRHRPAGVDQVRLVVALNNTFLLLDAAGTHQLLYPATVASHAPSPGLAARWIAKAGARLPMLMDRIQRRRFAHTAANVIGGSLARADVGADDTVLLLDAWWGGSEALAAARICRYRGATVAATVYDLIPVTHPAYMTPVAAKLFARRLGEALDLCDGFVAISHATAAALATFAATTGRRHVRIEVAYCGSDFAPPTAASCADTPPRAPGAAYISVGTLEPRKGNAIILDAFERLWAEGSTAQLTFVGRRGWGVNKLWQRCEALTAEGHPFRLIQDADDEVLDQLLAQSSAAIVASAVEGFGLPVVEALNRNLPVIASDISVFREIATGAVSFFDAANPGSLADAIRNFERDPAPMLAAARQFTWPTWQGAAPGYARAALSIREQARDNASAARSA